MLTEKLLKDETELEESVKSDGLAGETEALIIAQLVTYVYPRKLGRVFGSQTDFELKEIGKRQPDAAFVSLERLPVNVLDTVPLVPDLAVEVVSKSDKSYDIDAKVDEYLQAGVKLVWVIRPTRKIIEVYHPGDLKPLTLGIADELDGENVLPGFKLKVSELFV